MAKNIQIKNKSGELLYPATNLSLSNNIGSLSIDKGGTGATTIADARNNLDVYSKTEIESKISAIDQFQYKVVDSLPTASASTEFIIYLVKDATAIDGSYVEYLTIKNAEEAYVWEKIGTTSTDLSGYSKNTHTHNFTGSQGNVSVSGTYSTVTSVSISKGTGSANYTPEGTISLSRSANVALNTASITGISDVGSLPSLTNSTISATDDISYLKDVSISDNKIITYSDPTFNTSDIYSITSVGTLPSLDVNSTASGGIAYVSRLTKGDYTPEGTITASFIGVQTSGTASFTPTGSIDLGSNTTSTNGVTYIEDISDLSTQKTTKYLHKTTGSFVTGVAANGTASAVTGVSATAKYLRATFNGSETSASASLTPTGTISLSNGTAPSFNISSATSTGATAFVSSISSNAAKASSTDTFVKTINGGSGSLTSDSTASGGIAYVSAVTKSSYTPAGKVSGTLSGSTLTIGFSGTATNNLVTSGTTKYLHHTHNAASVSATSEAVTGVSGGSTTATLSYMKFNAGTTPKSSATFTGNSSSATVKLTPSGSVTLTASTVTSTGAINYIESASASGFANCLTGVKASGTASALTNITTTASASTGDITYIEAIGSTSVTTTKKYLHPSFKGTQGNVSISFTPSGTIDTTFMGTKTNALVTGGTNQYIHFNAGSLPSRSTSAIKAYTSIATKGSASLGGSIELTKTNNYLKFSAGTLPTKTSAQTFATGVKTQPSFEATFSGTGVELKTSITSSSATINSTGKFTPEGSIGQAK